MSARGLFDETTVSDQKRLVRGEQLLSARTRLRVRDGVHHKAWRILMTSGMAPAGEVTTIRELMPKARIIAVDRDEACVRAAIDAGADDVIHADLSEFRRVEVQVGMTTQKRLMPPREIERAAPFDVVDLDLCAGVSGTTKELVAMYRRHNAPKLLAKGGVVIVTFSYGRDVVEVFRDAQRYAPSAASGRPDAQWAALRRISGEASPEIAGRLLYLFGYTPLPWIHSLMLYRGREMPMCSVLLQPCVDGDIAVTKVGPGDFELAVCYPDPATMYDCPKDRIEALRRKHAAIKAAYTRRGGDEVATA